MIFPVKIPYTVAPDISKYNGDAFDKELNAIYISEKEKELKLHREKICAQSDDCFSLIQIVSEYYGLKNVDTMEKLALHFNEDIAILKKGIVKGICFCFPSSFVPSKLIEKSFFSLHEPVAENQKLLKASDKIVELISEKNLKFRRYVWTISSLSTLSQLPYYKRPDPKKIEDLYFRTETQTTVGLGDGICTFFIKVEMKPLKMIWDESEKRNQIIDSISSMSPAIIEYKSLKKIKDILLHNA